MPNKGHIDIMMMMIMKMTMVIITIMNITNTTTVIMTINYIRLMRGFYIIVGNRLFYDKKLETFSIM